MNTVRMKSSSGYSAAADPATASLMTTPLQAGIMASLLRDEVRIPATNREINSAVGPLIDQARTAGMMESARLAQATLNELRTSGAAEESITAVESLMHQMFEMAGMACQPNHSRPSRICSAKPSPPSASTSDTSNGRS